MPFFIKSIIITLMLSLTTGLAAQRIIPDEKKLDYFCDSKKLREVLFDLSEITQVTIAWQDQYLPSDSLVSLSIKNEKLGRLLNHLLEGHDLKYKIVGNQISIVRDRLANSDSFISISGFIRDAESGETLVDAHITTQDSKTIAYSNEYGFYSLTLPKGIQRLYISYIGYERNIIELSPTRDTTVNIELESGNIIKDIIISDLKYLSSPEEEFDIANVYTIPLSRMNRAVSLAGEPDVIRTAMTTAGVSTGTDGFGGMSVRGGSENQNLVLLDGIPVYGSNHAFGLFSIFNSNVIKSARIYKGTLPAHYSGRLSSVLDIRTREGNEREYQGQVSVGLFTAKASIEGPIIKDRASFLLSARRTFVDPWIGSATEALNRQIGKIGRTEFSFYDINGKLNFKIGDHSRLFLSYYTGNDNFDNDVVSPSDDGSISLEDRDEVQWKTGNTLAALRWHSRISHKLFFNVNVFESNYNFDAFDHDRIELKSIASNEFLSASYDAGYYKSAIKDRGTRLHFDYLPGPKQTIKFGAAYTNHNFSPGLQLSTQADGIVRPDIPITQEILAAELNTENLIADEFEFFVSNEIKLGHYTKLNLGFNHLLINTGSRNYNIAQPRILFSTGSENYSFRASWGRAGQFMHSLVNTGLGIPIDVWLPSSGQLEPEQSWMITNGHFVHSKALGLIGVELFYKEMDNLTRYSESGLINISQDSNWESLLPVGEGYAYGAEFSLEKNKGRTHYYFSYTLSWSQRNFDGLNNGETFRYRYDRRHVVNISLVHRINPDLDFTINWHYGSGTPVTVPSGNRYFDYNSENAESELVLVYDGINNAVLPAYHRLDVGFNFRNTYDWGSSVFSIGLYNAYNRQNTFYRDILVDLENPNQNLRFEDVTLLPILPSISYSLQF